MCRLVDSIANISKNDAVLPLAVYDQCQWKRFQVAVAQCTDHDCHHSYNKTATHKRNGISGNLVHVYRVRRCGIIK